MSGNSESTTRAKRTRVATFCISLIALLISCSNMLTGNDMKAAIGTDVASANATPVKVNVQVDPNNQGGTTSLNGIVDEKVGIPFPITATTNPSYVFTGWSQVGGAGEIAFDSTTSATTNAKVTKFGNGLTLQANYTPRPFVTSTDPPPNFTVGTNKTIKFLFSKTLDAKTLILSNIDVTAVNSGDFGVGTPTDITSRFNIQQVVFAGATLPSGFSLALNPGETLGIVQRIDITLKKAIGDSSGNMMEKDYPFTVFTSASQVNPPTIISASFSKDGASDLGLNTAFKAFPLFAKVANVNVDTSSGQSLTKIRFILTDTDSGGVKLSGSTSETIELPFGSGYNTFTPVNAHPDGYKTLEIQVKDNYDQWSIATPSIDQKLLIYDTTPPVISSFSPPAYTDSLSQSIAIGATDSGSGIAGYSVSGDGTGSSTSSPIAFTLSTGDGKKNIVLTATDQAGNSSSSAKSIVVDTVPPVLTLGAIASSSGIPYAKAGDTISIAFTASDANLGPITGIIAGKPATIVNTSGTSYKATWVVLSGDAQGTVGYSVTVTDLGSHSVTKTSASGTVSIDTLPPDPRAAALTVTGSGPNGAAKVGSTVTASWDVSGDPSMQNSGLAVKADFSAFGGGIKPMTLTGTTWTATSGSIPSGTINGVPEHVAITATDLAGNQAIAVPSTQALSVDNQAPAAPSGIAFTVNNAGSNNEAKIGSTVTAGLDESGDATMQAGASVSVNFGTWGGGVKPATYSSSTHKWSATSDIIAAGSINGVAQTVAVTATDATGNATGPTTSAATVTEDNLVPDPSAVALSASNPGPSGEAKVGSTVTASWNVSGDASMQNAGLSVSVNFSAFGGGNVAATYSSSTHAWTATSTALVAGSLNRVPEHATMTVTDMAGNQAVGVSSTQAVTVDDQPPTPASVALSINGAGPNGDAKIGSSVTASWDVSGDATMQSAGLSVSVDFSAFGGGVKPMTLTGTTWAATSGSVPAGSLNHANEHVAMTAADTAGNLASAVSSAQTVSVDNQAPASPAGIILAVNSPGPNGDAKVSSTVTASLDESGDATMQAGASVSINFGTWGGGVKAATFSVTTHKWSATSDTIAAGSINGVVQIVAVTATDSAGNATGPTTSSATVTEDNQAPDPSVVALSVNGAGPNGAAKVGSTVTASWNVSGDATMQNAGLAVNADFSAFGGGNVAATYTSATHTWSATSAAVVAGALNGAPEHATMTATDTAGNQTSGVSSTQAVTVDDQLPTPATVTLSINGAGPNGDAKIGSSVTASWDVSGDLSMQSAGLSVSVDFTAFGGGIKPMTLTGTTWTSTSGGIPAGSLNHANEHVAMTATDTAGNLASAVSSSATVSVDNQAPASPAGINLAVNSPGPNGDAKVSSSVTASLDESADTTMQSGASVSVDFGTWGGGVKTATFSGTTHKWSATSDTIAAGSINGVVQIVAVTATDSAGNATGPTTSSASVTEDNKAPDPSVVALSINSAGPNGAGKIGSTVTASWDVSTDATMQNAGLAVNADFSAFGGGNVAATYTSATHTWSATSAAVVSGALNGLSEHVAMTATDTAGNQASAVSSTQAVTVDDQLPTPASVALSVNGAGPNGDAKIGSTVTASWNVSGDATMQSAGLSVSMDFTAFGGGTASATYSSGTWTATSGAVPAGSLNHSALNVAVTAADTAGNLASAVSSTQTVSVDNQAPASPAGIALTVNSAGTNGDAKVSSSVTASLDESGDTTMQSGASVSVDFGTWGGGVKTATFSGTTHKWSATSDTITAGSINSVVQTVAATATDAAGNATGPTTSIASLTEDNQAPDTSAVALSVNSAGTNGDAAIGSTVTATWDVSGDSTMQDPGLSVNVNFTALGGGTVSATLTGTTWTATSATLVSGTVNGVPEHVTMTATDTAGNLASGVSSTQTVTVDDQLPTPASVALSVNGAGPNGDAKVGSTVTANWNVSGDATMQDAGLSVSMDFTAFGGGTASATYSSGTWTATSGAVPAGSLNHSAFNVAVTAADTAGNLASAVSSTQTVSVDNQAPASPAGIALTVNSAGTNGDAKVSSSVTASLDESGDTTMQSGALVSVDFGTWGGGVKTATFSGTTHKWSATSDTITAGSINSVVQTVAATATDAAGNATGPTTSTASVTEDNQAPDTSAVALSVSGAGTNGDAAIGSTVTASWDVSTDSTMQSAGLAVSVNFSALGGGTVSATLTGTTWSATSAALVSGTINGVPEHVTMTATDTAGNLASGVSSTQAVTVDDQLPTPASVALSVNGAGPNGDAKVGSTVTASWNVSGDATMQDAGLSVSMDFTAFGGGTASATYSSGTWTATSGAVPASSLNHANEHVGVTAADTAGNLASAVSSTQTVSVDNQAPASPAGIALTVNSAGTNGDAKVSSSVTASLDESGDATMQSGASVSVDFGTWGGGVKAATFSGTTHKWTATSNTITAGSINGVVQTVAVTATDAAGNATGPTTSTASVTEDNQAPTPSVVALSVNSAGPNGAAKIGSTVTASWDVSGDATMQSAGLAVSVNFTAFGGGTVTATYTSATHTWSATSTAVVAGALNGVTEHVAMTATDTAGNLASAVSSTQTVAVDNQTPTPASVALSVTSAGPNGDAAIGSTVTASWDVSGDATMQNAGLSVSMNFSAFGGGTASATYSGGTWTATSSNISAGSINGIAEHVTTTATDDAGNQASAVSSTQTVTVDDQLPTPATVTLSITGAGTNGDAKVGSTVMASWNVIGDTTMQSSGLAVSVDFTAFGGGTASATYTSATHTWAATSAALVSGSLNNAAAHVAMTATDTAGNQASAVSSTQTVTVDNQMPDPSVVALSVNSAGPNGAAKIGSTVTASWNVTADATMQSAGLAVSVNFTAFGGGTVTATYTIATHTWSATSAAVVAGALNGVSEHVAMTATDTAGNQASAVSSTQTEAVDNQAPAPASVALSVNSAGPNGDAAIGSTVTASWDVSGDATMQNSGLSVSINFSAFGGGTASATYSSGTWTATSSNISAGSINGIAEHVTTTATDTAGNQASAVSSTQVVTVDDQLPTPATVALSVTGAGPNGDAKVGSTVTASWNVSGDTTMQNTGLSVSVDFTAFGGGTASATYTSATHVWAATSAAVAAGALNTAVEHVAMTATDTAGNQASAVSSTQTVTVDDQPPDPSVVALSVNSAGPNGNAAIGSTVTASWNVSGDTTMQSAGLAVSVDFTAFGGGTGTATYTSATHTWSATSSVLGSGVLNAVSEPVAMTATDTAGNQVSAVSSTQAVTVDDQPPSPASVALSVNNAGPNGDAAIGSTVTASWDVSGDATMQNAGLSVSVNFTAFGGGTVSATYSGGTWTATSAAISAGSINGVAEHATITATDLAGNPASAVSSTATVTVDDKAPTLATNYSTSLSANTLTITLSTFSSSDITYLYAGSSGSEVLVAGTITLGSPFTLTTNYTGAAYYQSSLSFYVLDAAGNTSSTLTDPWTGSAYQKSLGPPTSIRATSVARYSAPIFSPQELFTPVFLDTTPGAARQAESVERVAGAKLPVSYKGEPSPDAAPLVLDRSGVSILRRAAGVDATLPTTEARYAVPKTNAAQAAIRESLRTAARVAAPRTASGGASTATGSSAVTASYALGSPEAYTASAGPSASGSVPAAPQPSTPASTVPGPDLFVSQARERRKESRENCGDEE